jgi:hypothetical protein
VDAVAHHDARQICDRQPDQPVADQRDAERTFDVAESTQNADADVLAAIEHLQSCRRGGPRLQARQRWGVGPWQPRRRAQRAQQAQQPQRALRNDASFPWLRRTRCIRARFQRSICARWPRSRASEFRWFDRAECEAQARCVIVNLSKMDTTMKGDWPIQLIPTDLILPNEQHVEARLLEVIDSIARSGRWTAPIVLESDSLAVMDGHHRLAAAKRGCIWPTAKRALTKDART